MSDEKKATMDQRIAIRTEELTAFGEAIRIMRETRRSSSPRRTTLFSMTWPFQLPRALMSWQLLRLRLMLWMLTRAASTFQLPFCKGAWTVPKVS